MNRTIKFRVWDKAEGVFSHLFSLPENEEYIGVLTPNQPMNYPHRYIYQQYTGLKDANDKEIYEGDILEEYLSPHEQNYYKVEWGNDGWFLILIDKDWNMKQALAEGPEYQPRMSFFYHDMKVVGNIFNNPELLEG